MSIAQLTAWEKLTKFFLYKLLKEYTMRSIPLGAGSWEEAAEVAMKYEGNKSGSLQCTWSGGS